MRLILEVFRASCTTFQLRHRRGRDGTIHTEAVTWYNATMRIVTKFTASGALAALILSCAASCSGDEKKEEATGAQLFQANCAQCHMADGAGSALAPPLHGKKSNWTRDTLVDYLEDPVGYAAKDPRLKAQGGKYSLPMPTYKMLSPADLEKLADHVLAMP